MKVANSFFIAGAQRSGTTLLSVLLSKHPKIHLDENSVGFRLVEAFGNYKRVLPYNLEYSWSEIQSWLIEIDYKGRVKDLLDGIKDFNQYDNAREIVNEGLNNTLHDVGKSHFGDKSPNIQFFANEILAIIPSAKFIHIVRDGRDVALSRKTRSHRNLYLAGHEWVDSNIVGLHNQKMIGSSQYFILKYEDLLTQPEKTMKEVCQFIDVPFDETIMLDQAANHDENSYVKDFFDTSKIARFNQELSKRQIKKLENWQGPLLKRFGYSTSYYKGDKKYKPMPVLLQICYSQSDNWKQLFRGRIIGMKRRKNVEIHVPLKVRFKRFGVKFIQDFFPEKLYRSVLKKMWVSQLYYNTPKQSKEEI